MLEAPRFIRFKFRKVGSMQFISHLDLQTVMQRVLIRAKAPLWYSQGFNPHPKMIFALPLSVGAQSECEYLDVRVERAIPPSELLEHINAEVTDELRFLDAYYAETDFESIYFAEYLYSIRTEGADEEMARKMQDLLSSDEIIIMKKTKDKYKNIRYKEYDIVPYLKNPTVEYADGEIKIKLLLSASINQTHPHINPDYVLTYLKEKLDILKGDELREEYSILRTRVLLENGEGEFR